MVTGYGDKVSYKRLAKGNHGLRIRLFIWTDYFLLYQVGEKLYVYY